MFAQTTSKIPVLTLGSFHFNFPNLDVQKIDRVDQIDVLDPEYQKEIEAIVSDLARFKPTIIVIERQPDQQSKVDSLYQAYLKGVYRLSRREDEQIGFRLAKASVIKRLYCVDEWGNFSEKVSNIMEGKDSIRTQRFESFYFSNPDSPKKTKVKPTIKANGIRKELLLINDEQRIRESLGDYLVGIFKYEEKEGDFLGVDFETGRWFNRNLKIFRNIQRIKMSSGDRMVVIFGSGHLNLLNYFFECSPEYELVKVKDYLK
jgi:hypothetical protein